jgi:glycosyltransferase involved in cell wall biosynthesis
VNMQDRIRRNTILFIAHEASATGAPRALLNIMRWLRIHTDFRLRLILRSGGELEKQYREIAEVHLESAGWGEHLVRDVCVIYSNTGTNGLYLRTLPISHIPVITHLHELRQALEWFGPENTDAILSHTTHFIACSAAVRTMLEKDYRVNPAAVSEVPEAIVPDDVRSGAGAKSAIEIRTELGIGADEFVVAGCGNAEVRKGADLFVLLARECAVRTQAGKVAFVWVGPVGNTLANNYYIHDIQKLGLAGQVRFVGQVENPHPILAACDLFCLPSREDPFPLVMLEAGALGKPTLAFCGSGGAEEYCRKGGGFLAPYLDIRGMADCIESLACDRAGLVKAGAEAKSLVEREFCIDAAGPAIEAIIGRVATQDDCLIAGTAQVFIPCAEGYSEQNSIRRHVKAHQWNHLRFRFFAAGNGQSWCLRFDPLDQPALIEIASITLRNRSAGALLWAAESAQDFSAVTAGGTAVRMPDAHRLKLLNLGSDAILYLPEIGISLEKKEYQMDVVLRADCGAYEIGNASRPLIQAYLESHDLKPQMEKAQQAPRKSIEANERIRMLFHTIAPAGGRPLYIWGTGTAGRQIAEILQAHVRDFQGFIDPDPARNGLEIMNHAVLSPQILSEAEEKPYIIIGSQFFLEIGALLRNLGFIDGKDYATPAWLL